MYQSLNTRSYKSLSYKAVLRKISIGLSQVALLMSLSFASFAGEINTNWRGLAIDGYDVVAYFDQGAPAKGSSKYSTKWKGATWRFSSAANLEKFQQDPDSFAPQYGGYCSYAAAKGYTADIEPEAWDIVNGKLYLNYNLAVRDTWRQDIPGYITKADQNWPDISAKL